ncbi:MAG: hypothetical protein PHQ36_12330 [Anaerolineales bacterium]|nr:hypothetical protein [Anaerolineales bacterium]
MNNWFAYDDGRSIGEVSAEGGVILRDEEHKRGGRMTLKQGKTFISVSCHIYKWMDHTRFFGSVNEAQREYVIMKNILGSMMDDILATGANDLKMWEAIADFVRRFP